MHVLVYYIDKYSIGSFNGLCVEDMVGIVRYIYTYLIPTSIIY